MAKREVTKALKLLKWHTHHEPHRVINGPLTYFLERVHAGGGREKLIKNIGLANGGQAIAFFDWLLRRTAKLPRQWRGYVLDGDHKPMSVDRVAREYGASDVRVRGWVKALGDVGWLGHRPLRRLLRKPSGALTNNEDERRLTTNERRPGGGRRKKSTAQISPSPSGKPELCAKLCGALGVNPRSSSDRTLISRMVEFHTNGDRQPHDSFAEVLLIADSVRTSAGVQSRMAVWQSELQKAGLHYRGNSVADRHIAHHAAKDTT